MPEIDKDVLKNIDKNIVKCINELGKKGDINPAETKAFLEGVQAREWIACQLEECEAKEHAGEEMKNSYRSYSMHGYEQPYRRYNITAYGHPMMDGYSGGYGVQGWYQSDDHGPMYQAGTYPMDRFDHTANGSYGNYPMGNTYAPRPMSNNMSAAEHREYSRHSVNDRVISIIEKSPELTNMTPFEQEEVRRILALIRTAE